MNVRELLTAVGDDNVKFQPLDQCATSLNWNAKSGTKITFRSDVKLTPKGTALLGLVVWLPRDAVQSAIAAPAQGEQP